VTNETDNTVSVLLGNGNGTFQPHTDYPTGHTPSSVAVADLNGDRNLDLAVTDYSDNSVSVLLGNGDGTFRAHVDYVTGMRPVTALVADFDGDGFMDLAIANEISQTVSILGGNGDGTFQPRSDYLTGSAIFAVVADFNEDGAADLAIVNSAASNRPNSVSILLNTQGTKISVRPSSNPSLVGQSLTFSGTVEGSLRGAKVPTCTVTVSEGSTVLGTATLAAAQFSAISSTLAVGTHSLSVVYSGDSSFQRHTVSLRQTVQYAGSPDFTVGSTPGSATVVAGTPASFTITATAQNGFASAISLACTSGLPPQATCQFSPSSINPGTNPGTSSLTVNTSARTTAHISANLGLYVSWLFLPAIAMSTITLAAPKCRRYFSYILLVLVFTALIWITACGGNSSGGANSGGGTSGTPVGIYNIVVTGSTGSTQHTSTVTLTVQ